jgi:NADPH-dependent stearoyl-CoA 9-desaturase
MHVSTGVGALGAMAPFLQHSPRQRSYDDLTDAEVEEIGHTLDAPRAKVFADLVARTTDLGG